MSLWRPVPRGKVTTVEGIDGRPAMIRALYDYWDRRRAGRAMPSRADIDPADFKAHLPHILLVDVLRQPDRFVYRLVGTGEVEVRGRDPTGQDVTEGFYGPSRADVLFCYGYVRDTGSFLLDVEPYLGTDGRFRQGEVLFLPLSRDGRAVDQILVYASVARLAR